MAFVNHSFAVGATAAGSAVKVAGGIERQAEWVGPVGAPGETVQNGFPARRRELVDHSMVIGARIGGHSVKIACPVQYNVAHRVRPVRAASLKRMQHGFLAVRAQLVYDA